MWPVLTLVWPSGEEAAVSVLHQREGEGVADGVSDSLHQSDWRPAGEGGASGRPEERLGEFCVRALWLLICKYPAANALYMERAQALPFHGNQRWKKQWMGVPNKVSPSPLTLIDCFFFGSHGGAWRRIPFQAPPTQHNNEEESLFGLSTMSESKMSTC